MKDIFWDAYGLHSIYSGVGRYAWHLALSLQKLGSPPQILPSVPVDPAFQEMLAAPSAKAGRVRNLKPFALQRSKALLERGPSKAAIIHGLSNYNIPQHSSKLRSILTLHDVIPLLDPRASSKSLRYFLSWQMPRTLRRADLIVCSSLWTKGTVEELFPECRSRTVFMAPGRPERTNEGRLPLHRPQLLTVSRSEPYKRLDLIPKILKHLPENILWSVVCDSAGQALLAAEAGDDKRLRIHSSLPDADLERLWRSSKLYIHPSLMEGYGLPVAEALSYGVPSLVTSGSGVDEALGIAGKSLSPRAKAGDWAAAIHEMLEEDWRDRCAAQYASLPTWDDVGKQVLTFYDRVE